MEALRLAIARCILGARKAVLAKRRSHPESSGRSISEALMHRLA